MAKSVSPLIIPADVAPAEKERFTENYHAITNDAGRLFMFACDQKVEHLNDDFSQLPFAEMKQSEHFFKIAQAIQSGAMATNFGLINRYGPYYPELNYIVKINGKTNATVVDEPISNAWYSVEEVATTMQDAKLNLRGIGYTLYLGSEHEQSMLIQAAQTVYDAHQHGLVALLWIYPRGKAVKDQFDKRLLTGAAGLANVLGADFVKLHMPPFNEPLVQEIVAAAGNTKILLSGGIKADESDLQKSIELHIRSGFSGIAIGRNLFQRSKEDAMILANALKHTLAA